MSRTRALRAGELRVAEAPGRLVIHGLGSCVAIFVYDPARRIGGLAHTLLPHPPPGSNERPARYAASAVDVIVEESLRRGARRAGLLGKITGGSRMFSFEAEAGRPPIGERNVEAALRALQRAGVRVVGTDVGGECGRTVVADLNDGTLTIRTLRGGARVL